MHTNRVFFLLATLMAADAAWAADSTQLPNGLAITPTAAPDSMLMPLNPHLDGKPVTRCLSLFPLHSAPMENGSWCSPAVITRSAE
jgi:hypothetical protein